MMNQCCEHYTHIIGVDHTIYLTHVTLSQHNKELRIINQNWQGLKIWQWHHPTSYETKTFAEHMNQNWWQQMKTFVTMQYIKSLFTYDTHTWYFLH